MSPLSEIILVFALATSGAAAEVVKPSGSVSVELIETIGCVSCTGHTAVSYALSDSTYTYGYARLGAYVNFALPTSAYSKATLNVHMSPMGKLPNAKVPVRVNITQMLNGTLETAWSSGPFCAPLYDGYEPPCSQGPISVEFDAASTISVDVTQMLGCARGHGLTSLTVVLRVVTFQGQGTGTGNWPSPPGHGDGCVKHYNTGWENGRELVLPIVDQLPSLTLD